MIVRTRVALKGYDHKIARIGQVTDAAMRDALSYNCTYRNAADRISVAGVVMRILSNGRQTVTGTKSHAYEAMPHHSSAQDALIRAQFAAICS